MRLLLGALEDLGASMALGEVERLAVMINQAMTLHTRSFHTPEHIFDLVDPSNPRTTLAALFHDLVYYNVDQGFTPQIAESVSSSIEAREGELWVSSRPDPADRALAVCLAVFGFEHGQKMSPFGGMNEFLSALVMNRKLFGIVREEDLLPVTACIEATIPFRAADSSGQSPAERLAERLRKASRDFGLDLSEQAVRRAVMDAVMFANRDVANFAVEEVTRFLDNTWKLLPETNPSLRTQGIYSIGSYRVALQKMEGFLQSLDPRTIFARYGGEPPDEEFERMLARATRNVTTARDYLGMKLLTAAILEALADMSGGDAPVPLFMGDIDAAETGSRLQDHLPPPAPRPGVAMDSVLHDLLAHGRASASSFDLQNSPLSLFLYLHLGNEGFRALLGMARRRFTGAVSVSEFLDALPGDMVAAVAEGCARMAFTRSDQLLAYAASRRRKI
jgi:hypothetical protein